MRYIVSFIFCFLFSVTAANAAELRIEANEDGKVVVESERTLDGNELILNEAENGEEYTVMMQPAAAVAPTVFTTNDYRAGFFDNPTTTYTHTFGEFFDIYTDNLVASQAANKTGYLTFDTPISLSGYFVSGQKVVLTFYDSTNKVVATDYVTEETYKEFQYSDIKKIRVHGSGTNGSFSMKEMEFFIKYEMDYIAVSGMTFDTKDYSATVTYSNPNSEYFRYNQILLDGEVVVDNTTETAIELEDLEALKKYDLTVRSYYVDGKFIDINTTFTTKRDTTPPAKVTDLKAVQVKENVLLQYTLPTDNDFSHVRITQNGLIVNANTTENSFTNENVQPGVYEYRVFSFDKNGNASAAAIVKIEVVGFEVTQLKTNAKYDQVALSWVNSKHTELETVKIYRKNKDQGLMRTFMMAFSENDGYTALFATNGTTFEDLTVDSDTAYTYKVTSVIDGNESEGVTVDVKTPKITVDGGSITPIPTDPSDPKSPAKDYVIKWKSPNTGQLKVVIGGSDYKNVNAADLQVTIPATDMVLDKFGNPDVLLVPVDDQGTVIGVPTNPGSGGATWGGINLGDLGLNPKSLITVAAALLGLIGMILLLAMSFRVAPKIIVLIKNSFR